MTVKPTLLAVAMLAAAGAHANELKTQALDDLVFVENGEAGMVVNLRFNTLDGQAIEMSQPSEAVAAFDLAAITRGLPDGQYSYEVWTSPPDHLLVTRGDDAELGLPAEAFGGITPASQERISGSFRIQGGLMVDPTIEE